MIGIESEKCNFESIFLYCYSDNKNTIDISTQIFSELSEK